MSWLLAALLTVTCSAQLALAQSGSANGSGPSAGAFNANVGGASVNDQYVVLAPSADLLNERVLATSGGITLTDGGAGNSVTLGLTKTLANGFTGGTSAQSALNSIAGTSTKGDILYFDGTNWSHLGIGGSGNVLGISGGVPAWGSGAGGAPTSSAYIIVGTDATLTGYRSITAGTGILGTDGGATSTYTLAIDTSVVTTLTGTQALTNKTLNTPIFGWNSGLGVTLQGSGSFNYVLDWTSPSASRVIHLPDPGANANVVLDEGNYFIQGNYSFLHAPILDTSSLVNAGNGTQTLAQTGATNDTIVEETATETLTNKTFTAPQITNASTITWLQTSGNYIISAATHNPSANRTYSWADVGTNGDIPIIASSTTYANGGTAYANGNTLAVSAAGSSGQVWTSNGSGAPSWQTPSGMLTVSGTLTAAQLHTAHSAPISIVSAPGSGKWIFIISIEAKLNGGGTAYASGNGVNWIYHGTAINLVAGIPNSSAMQSTTSNWNCAFSQGFTNTTSGVDNLGIDATAPADFSGLGTETVDYTIQYVVVAD